MQLAEKFHIESHLWCLGSGITNGFFVCRLINNQTQQKGVKR